MSRGGFKGGHRSRHEVVIGGASFSPAQDYVRLYPEAAKWVERCGACGREGYRPDLPADARFSRDLKRLLEPIELDDRGLCDVCSGVVSAGES